MHGSYHFFVSRPCSTVPPCTFTSALLPRLLSLFCLSFCTQSRFHFHHSSRSRFSIQLSKPQVVPGQVTKASSWDKPECLKNADEKLNTTSWKERLAITKSLQSKTLVFGKFVAQSAHLTLHWSLCRPLPDVTLGITHTQLGCKVQDCRWPRLLLQSHHKTKRALSSKDQRK